MKNQSTFKRTAVSAAVVALMAAGSVQAAIQTFGHSRVFSVYDLVASFDGQLFGSLGNYRYKSMLCSNDGTWPATCDPDHAPIAGDEAATLYPIDSEFGFNVVPYAIATQKTLDQIYAEGYAGNITDGSGNIIGLELADAETDTFQVPAGLGTWCSGIGGSSVKCSTEHYVVMEHVLTCHETVAYVPTGVQYVPRADPTTGAQAVWPYDEDGDGTPDGSIDCSTTKLDNDLLITNTTNPTVDGRLLSELAGLGVDPANPLEWLDPNESTVLDDIAVGDDFSITAKDDGKPLYRWGTLIKRPNDIRIYKRYAVPTTWKDGSCAGINIEPGTGRDLGCRVTKAELRVNHKVTNNPNDQIRPEDMENEAAIGRLPGYDIEVNTYGTGTSWVSDTLCYEGDGDLIPQGVVLKNAGMALGGDYAIVGTDPYAWSGDLESGLSNAWYTTVDREPFEWSYDTDGDGAADQSRRAPISDANLPAGWTLLSGPRWRLTPGKFGQDLPALDIPNVNCAPPPYAKALIKYEVGAAVRTVINLLDWSSQDERSVIDPASGLPVSPLTFSNGWVDADLNDGTVINPDVTVYRPQTLTGVTVNGSPATVDFDVTYYVKGDRKPTALYNSYFYVEWDDGNP